MYKMLAFFKPDMFLRRNAGINVMKELNSLSGLSILSFQQKKIDKNLVDKHYAHVKARPFYSWLVDYVTVCPIYVMIVSVTDEKAAANIRDFLGSTISHQAREGSIRNRFGIYAGINCLHFSDSLESGSQEVALWKQQIGIEENKYDITINKFVSDYTATTPDYTLQIRSICSQIAEVGEATYEQQKNIFDFLSVECYDAEKDSVNRLTQSIIGACLR